MGYPFGHKAYKLLNLETRQMFTSRDVVFHERVLPVHTSSLAANPTLFPSSQSFELCCSEDVVPSSSQVQHDVVLPEQATVLDHSLPSRRSVREHKTPSYPSEYICSSVLSQHSSSLPSCCPNTVSSICCNVSLTHDATLSSNASKLLHHLYIYSEPASYEEAATKPEWQEAMQKEFDALQANNTWILTPLPAGKKPISCKWVYKLKYKVDGTLERCKARLVIRGFYSKSKCRLH